MASEEFKRKLTTIFSADVVDYSRLMGEDESATVKTLETYKGVMFSLIKQHRGRVVDSTGDNLLAEFGSVVDAVQCAVAVQKELQSRNSDLPDNRKMLFRIGINLGDVIEEKERLYGDGVNIAARHIAARLEALSEPGGICISKTAFDHIESKLPLGYEFLGEQTVKNIAKPVGAYKILMERRVLLGAEKEETKVRLPDKPLPPLPEKPSVAVLPFVNMSGDPEQEYFSDGITEDIIAGLAKVPKLFVIARNSTFTYKGKPVKVQEVGKELGVRYVLEGSIQRSGDRVRVTAQLIDAQTGNHLWAERYDRKLKDIFALQDEITMKIITELQVELTEGEEARLLVKGTDNIEAYLKTLRGHSYLRRHNTDDYVRARQMLEEAIELDPEYATAYASLAEVYIYAGSSLGKSVAENEKQAHKLLQKALTIDETDYRARLQLGIQYGYDRQYEKAIAEFKNVIDLYPSLPAGHVELGITLLKCGKPEEAILHLKKVLRLMPIMEHPPVPLGVAYRDMGRYKEAIQVFKEILLVQPKNVFALVNLASTYVALEREEEAREIVKEILQWNPNLTIEKLLRGRMNYKNPADNERLAEQLRKAGLPD
jgi:adenylate cyclase